MPAVLAHRRQPKVEDGEIAAVRIGEEATLKRVYYDGSTITLVPANSAYRPKMYSGPAQEVVTNRNSGIK
jgi:repressor LexA